MDSNLSGRIRAHARDGWVAVAWRVALGSGFLLTCLRFQVAAVRSSGTHPGPTILLGFASLILGLWNPASALFAFTLAVPILNGLSQCYLVGSAYPSSLVFSALWMGMAANALIWGSKSMGSIAIQRGARGAPPFPHGEENPGAASPESARNDGGPGRFSWLPDLPILIAEMLIAAVLFSLAWQLWRNRDSPGLWPAVLDRPVHGFNDHWYFLTSAFLWLQGLFYFTSLYGIWARQAFLGADGESGAPAVDFWAKAFFLAYGFSLAVFALFELVFHIPEGWTSAGLQSPYEDISSFGSIALAVLIFTVATRRAAPLWKLAVDVLCCITLLSMLLASWSRGAWLAGLVFLMLISLLRLPRAWTAAFLAVLVTTFLLVNAGSKTAAWQRQPYLERVATLVRVESPATKDPERMNLYRKASAMIHRHPAAGQGIGSFYLSSVDYARPNDPYGGTPDFAHNFLLQFAAELGLPIAALFCGMIAWSLWLGLRRWFAQASTAHQCSARTLLVLGVTLSLAAYLQTQMTGNSLNVYVSNQFFFWFLMAVLFALALRGRGRAPAARTA
jgi:O-antigen ligase